MASWSVRLAYSPRAPESPSSNPGPGFQATRAETCLPSLSSWKRGLPSVPWVTAAASDTGSEPTRASIPVSQRKAVVPDRVAHEPAAAALPQEVVGGAGCGVGARDRQVLIRERVADERVVRA